MPSEARVLHEKIAIWLEQNPALAGKDSGPKLAHHWQKAENIEKAMSYYAKAAEVTMAAYQHRDGYSPLLVLFLFLLLLLLLLLLFLHSLSPSLTYVRSCSYLLPYEGD